MIIIPKEDSYKKFLLINGCAIECPDSDFYDYTGWSCCFTGYKYVIWSDDKPIDRLPEHFANSGISIDYKDGNYSFIKSKDI